MAFLTIDFTDVLFVILAGNTSSSDKGWYSYKITII